MSIQEDYQRLAEHFVRQETQFHLGRLITEQSHPHTRGLAEKLREDLEAGIAMLQRVDWDVAMWAREAFFQPAVAELMTTITEALRSGHRICFSGCGATGRLAILLEAMWRRFWQERAAAAPAFGAQSAEASERLLSLMTGGDYALIRSVEGFEDYISFGRQQLAEAGLVAGDVLVGISEGGETSSVIGTILEARARGLKAFFVFNNPASLLCEMIERSRRVIADPAVTCLELTTGPMAVAGSTRMQATTAELLILGWALQEVLRHWLPERLSRDLCQDLLTEGQEEDNPADLFTALLDDLGTPEAISALATWVRLEEEIYKAGGRVTYFANDCLLDIFTDTTERSPTFALPPFRKWDDQLSPAPWAFVKDPLRPTPQAWRHALGREPRCLEWDRSLYEALGAAAAIVDNPPALGREELMKFRIGNEPDPSRTERRPNAALAILLTRETQGDTAAQWRAAFAAATEGFERRIAVLIGETAPAFPDAEMIIHIPCRLPNSPLRLWEHLAVKLILNTVSTATMGRMGRLISNWMIYVECANKKLIDRATRLIAELTGLDYASACLELHRTLAEQRANWQPGQPRISPVAATLQRLRPGILPG